MFRPITVLIVLAVTVGAWAPYKDTPYPQVIAHRFLYQGQEPKADWPILNVPNVAQFAVIPLVRFNEQLFMIGGSGKFSCCFSLFFTLSSVF